jgi:hypothetical protein
MSIMEGITLRHLARTFALAATLTAAAPTLAADHGPSTPADRKKAVDITRRLERAPLAATANDDRIWLFKWIDAVPDITVRSCAGLLDGLPGDDQNKFGRKLYAQSMFGMAAFMIENPGKKNDWVAVQTAGIESTLKAYEVLVKAKPSMRWEELDRLILARDQGRLPDVVESQLEGCGDEHAPGPGDAI